MTVRISTALAGAILGSRGDDAELYTATTIAFLDGTGTGGADAITDSANGLAGFVRRGKMWTANATTGGNNGGFGPILTVAAGEITFATGTFAGADAAGPQVILAQIFESGALASLMENCFGYVYTGNQPTSADDAATGDLIGKVSLDGGAFAHGTATNGLNLAWDPVDNTIAKTASDTWKMIAETFTGEKEAGYLRLVSNDSALNYRIDMRIASSGAECIMPIPIFSTGATRTIESVLFSMPLEA